MREYDGLVLSRRKPRSNYGTSSSSWQKKRTYHVHCQTGSELRITVWNGEKTCEGYVSSPAYVSGICGEDGKHEA